MAANNQQFTNLSTYSESVTNYREFPVNNNTRVENDYDNSKKSQTSSRGLKWFLIVMIVISIGLLITCIVLSIVLATKFKSTERPTFSSTIAPPSQPFLLKCEPDLKKQIETRQRKNQHTKLKLPSSPERNGNLILLKNTYIVEYPTDINVRNHFRSITASLKASKKIVDSEIKIRNVIQSSLFNGASFSVSTNNSIEALKLLEDAIDIHPVYLIPAPQPIRNSFSSDASIERDSYLINAFELTGVAQVHKNFKNFGAGVRVAVIDSGIDYTHPALGGCFGPGCKVAFGYDLAGDRYSSGDPTAVADNDPIDNCTTSAHGTHVAGIIAANITGINNTFFTPSVPFSGVAPDVVLGAYRVFGCPGDYAGTDLITEAIYRAYDDKADIITISVGGPAAYTEQATTTAVERVTNKGVYVTISMGNSGNGGLYTSTAPSLAPDAMTVGSADNSYTLRNFIIGPGGHKIFYNAGSAFGLWKSSFNSTIVINDPSGSYNDGCSGLNKSVEGAVVLFALHSTDSCGTADRCNKAANAGAIACLLYPDFEILGSSSIPSGSISVEDGQRIIETVTANSSAVYTFNNAFELFSVKTVGTPSDFSSYGLTGDLLIKPQIMGIGGMVYSTVSTAYTHHKKILKPYDIMSGTSMAAPYVAGVLALFLSNIGNPAPHTINGLAEDGKCRPKFSVAMNLFQSTAKIVKNYNSSLFATTAKQGAGLVNAFQALTATTIFSPSELGLNDTIRKATSYKVNVINIGDKRAVYKMSHQGAELATGVTPNDDQLLAKPLFSSDYANVTIEPTEFALQPGRSREITLRFNVPYEADPKLLPVYSGFISATNQDNGEIAHMFYAGVVGDYGNARIFVRNSSSGLITGIKDRNGTYISDEVIPILNATEGHYNISVVLAWPTRIFFTEVVPAVGDILVGLNVSSALIYSRLNLIPLIRLDAPRNVIPDVTEGYLSSYSISWQGEVILNFMDERVADLQIEDLHPGRYKIKFSALKHFGNPSNLDDFEVYHSPPFDLVF